MNCHPELTYSIYADGELPAAEARQVEAHLESCARCGALVAGLGSEAQLLAAVLQDPEEAPAAAPLRPRDILWTALGVVGAAAGLQAGLDWLGGLLPEAGGDWLSAFSFAGQMNLFFSALFYFVREGAALLTSTITMLSLTFAGLASTAGAVWFLRRRPAALAVLATLLVALVAAAPAAAIERRHGRSVHIAAGETLEGTLLISGERATIEGVVNGDLIFFGRRLDLRGTVKGNTIVFAQSGDLKGTVEGSVFAWVQHLEVPGKIGGTIYVFAQDFVAADTSVLARDLVAFTAANRLAGRLERDATLFTASAEVSGSVGRHLTVYGEDIDLLPTAKVGGDLTAHVKKDSDLTLSPGATVAGKTETRKRPSRQVDYTQPKIYVQYVLGLGISFGIGLLLLKLFPAWMSAVPASAGSLARAGGIGFLTLVGAPAAALVLAILLCAVGVLADVLLIFLLIPVLVCIAWLLAIYLAKVFVAPHIGRVLFPAPAAAWKPLLAGLLILYVAMILPYVGPAIRFLVWLVGLGLIVTQGRRALAKPAAA